MWPEDTPIILDLFWGLFIAFIISELPKTDRKREGMTYSAWLQVGICGGKKKEFSAQSDVYSVGIERVILLSRDPHMKFQL